jgi:fatty-acyl-CoA synthase
MSSSSTGNSADFWQGLLGIGDPLQRSLLSWSGDGYVRTGWSEVVQNASHMTAGLRRRGVAPGARVATILTNSANVVQGVMAVWLCGGAVASLPVPARGMDLNEYIQQITAMCEQLQPAVFVMESNMLQVLPEELKQRFPSCSWEELIGSGSIDHSPPGDDDVAFIQYSSGSTSTPKGCVLTAGAIAAQVGMLIDWIGVRRRGEVVSSWLPLSHDMGMFGTLLSSWASDNDLYLSTPERFMMAPRTWFGDIGEYGGTITSGTNTGLYLGARAYASGATKVPGKIDMRACIVGAERVEWQTLEYALTALGPYGFRGEMLMPAYGLAEATLAVTATPTFEAPRQVCLDAAALADGSLVEVSAADSSATQLVSAGRPIGGVELPDMPEGTLTEVRVKSPSLASGYWNSPQLTGEHFRDSMLVTNDLGFVRDGYLYMVGRSDDVISIAGRKVYTREIENAVDGLAGVRRGCSTLIGRQGSTSELTLFMELDNGVDGFDELARAAASVAMVKAAVALDECVFLSRGSLPKTPSGKIQRHRCRQLFDEGRLSPLATVRLASV